MHTPEAADMMIILFNRDLMNIMFQQVPDIGGEQGSHRFQFQELFVEQICRAGADRIRHTQRIISPSHFLRETVILIKRIGELPGADQ